MCPSLCGFDTETNEVLVPCQLKTTTEATKISTTFIPGTANQTTSITQCPRLNCKNGGTFDFNRCLCDCYPNWSGNCRFFNDFF